MTKYKPILFKLLFLYFLLLNPLIVVAQESDSSDPCSLPSNIAVSRPNENKMPTKIKLGIFIIDLKEINDSEQTFDIDFIIDAKWNDPRLSENELGKSLQDCKIEANKIWFPRVLDINIRSGEQHLEEVVYIDKNGNVNYLQRFMGIYGNNYDFIDFPFDKQILKIKYTSYDYGPEDIEFTVNEEKFGINEDLSIKGWSNFKLIDPIISNTFQLDENRNISSIEFGILANREDKYYIWKIIVPLSLIVFMAWAVFWIPAKSITPQISLSVATIFTLITFRFSISEQLPKVSYFTKMDYFVFASTLLIFFALASAIVIINLALKGKEEKASKIEKYLRIIYLILFLLILITSFILF